MRIFWSLVLPSRWAGISEEQDDFRRYRRIWRYSVLLTLLVAAAPLLVLAYLNLRQHEESLQAQIRYDISRTLTNTSRSLEFILRSRLAAVNLLCHEHSLEELSKPEDLTASLENLRRAFRGTTADAFSGFVDLGLIDADGDQVCYVGPYRLQGVNYREQEWFHQVVARGEHVSDVFLGYRKLPHLVITVKRETGPSRSYMLRATLDLGLLTQLLSLPGRSRASDIFLVNREGVLQTPSQAHGNLLEPCSLALPPFSPDMEVIDDFDEKGESYVLGYDYIPNTPFVLVVLKKRSEQEQELGQIRTEVISFLVVSLFLILLVVLWSATMMVKRIREADENRAQMLHTIEYTNKMATIGRLAASVAHEINNPLAIINEKAGLIRDLATLGDEFPHREKAVASLDSIIRSVERCSRVTHRLLGFTRRLEVRKESIDLASLIEEVVGFLGKEATHRSIRIETQVSEGVPTIVSDRGKLQQVFLNILNNAFAAVREGGRIGFLIHSLPDQRVAVDIQDDGEGISKENLKHVFEPFFSTKGEYGTGLGLSITYNLVRGLGGDIKVESELGKGTRFTVELPLESATAATE